MKLLKNKLFYAIWAALLYYMFVFGYPIYAQVIGDPPELPDPMPPLYIDYYIPYVTKES